MQVNAFFRIGLIMIDGRQVLTTKEFTFIYWICLINIQAWWFF